MLVGSATSYVGGLEESLIRVLLFFSTSARAVAGVVLRTLTTFEDPSDDLATKDRICWVSWPCFASIAPFLG